MTEDDFWAFVEGARRDGDGVLGRQLQLLGERLSGSSSSELLAYRDRWDEAEQRLFTWPVWDAACVLLGFVSDDFFSDVRAWIVAHGREVASRIAADPDALIELADDVEALDAGDAEALGMLVPEIWAQLTDDQLPPSEPLRSDPTGSRIDLGDAQAVRRFFPRLAELAADQHR